VARNEIFVGVPPERVWEELSTAERYADWVVGADRVRWADPQWPTPGAAFHHVLGVGPFKVKDRTKVIEGEDGRRLVLDAGVGPLGHARVELSLAESNGGTRVVMEEELTSGPKPVRRVADPLIGTRNVEALRRLRAVCEKAEAED
jgi:uncharacterized protein YndB with AHSA1/START domain